MAIIGTSRFNERIQFFNGQRLFASDLQDVEQFNREMRWLHNQSLHQAGVASGYAVSGNKDDRQVTIEPGYAVDSSGREIVLTQPEVLQVPPVANDGQGNPVYFDLTVAYPPDSQLKETETRDGVCASRSAVRLREKPVFCWVELGPTDDTSKTEALAKDRQAKLEAVRDDVEKGVRIRLARAEVLNCKLNQKLSAAERRNAKPAMQPFLSAGRTRNNNNWEPNVNKSGIEIILRVDTSSANFRTPPRYFAHAVGNRELTLEIKGKKEAMVLDGFVGLYKLSNKPERLQKIPDTDLDDTLGFIFSLLIPAILIDRKFPLADVSAALNPALKEWYVEWLGIEG